LEDTREPTLSDAGDSASQMITRHFHVLSHVDKKYVSSNAQ
jgi:hypothetical protein